MSTASMLVRSSTSRRIDSVHGSAPKIPIRSEDCLRVEALALHLVENAEEVAAG